MAIAPLALALLPLLPKVVEGVLEIYDMIANHPTTPEATRAQITALVADIRTVNAQIQAAPLPGDEPPSA